MTVETFEIAPVQGDIVHVSDAAAAHFLKQVEKQGAAGIRLSLKQAGCTGYKYIVDAVEETQAGDMALTLKNGVTLYIDQRYVHAVTGTEIDIRQQGLNVNLVMENPNVKDECGCGESFSIEG